MKKYYSLLLLVFIGGYCIGLIVECQFDISEWHVETRVVLSLMMGTAYFVVLLFTHIAQDTNEKISELLIENENLKKGIYK